jgi:hypothetical protein
MASDCVRWRLIATDCVPHQVTSSAPLTAPVRPRAPLLSSWRPCPASSSSHSKLPQQAPTASSKSHSSFRTRSRSSLPSTLVQPLWHALPRAPCHASISARANPPPNLRRWAAVRAVTSRPEVTPAAAAAAAAVAAIVVAVSARMASRAATRSTRRSTHASRPPDSTLDPRLKAALDFKEDKSVTYTRGALQGVCNTMAMAEVMRGFVLPGASHPPDDVRRLHFDEPRDCDGLRWIATDCLPHQVRRLHFDALVIAEGEWSTTCSLLGITKAVDKFATAIGLIVNMHLDTSSPSSLRSFTPRPRPPYDRSHLVPVLPTIVHTSSPSSLRSFVATGVAPQLVQLAQAGLECENLEYLKGETHYIAATMRKKTLLTEGVLKADAVRWPLIATDCH